MRRFRSICWCGLLLAASTVAASVTAQAQQVKSTQGRYFPLNQHTPPGTVAEWAMNAGKFPVPWMQPIRVYLPSQGTVTFYDGSPDRPVEVGSPAQAALMAGRMYRFRISGMDEFPGQEFWPTIELFDRLHPPVGQADRFPLEFELSEAEFEWAAAGRLVTKVIYLEQPNRVKLAHLGSETRVTDVDPSSNALAEADLIGRPMAIIRLGGRTPDRNQLEPQFFGNGGPVQLRVTPAAPSQGSARSGARTRGTIQQTSFNAMPAGITQELPCPPEPRWPTAGDAPYAPGVPALQMAMAPDPNKYPDEYLCDGGDRDDPVHYSEHNRHGLDTEDTVAEYIEHTGKNRVAPSSKVCVYSPRFGAIRSVSLPQEDFGLMDLANVKASTGGESLHGKLSLAAHNKREGTGQMRMRSRASGYAADQGPDALAGERRVALHDKINNLFEDHSFLRLENLNKEDALVLQQGAAAAVTWSREQNPIITAMTNQPINGQQVSKAAVFAVVDDRPSDQPGRLRLVKLADKSTAEPGEVITFTIRYDNTGAREVHSVRIIDNLTPRLAYVADSATSDRAFQFVAEDNQEGSSLLIWTFDEPLAPKTGGVLTFQAVVR